MRKITFLLFGIFFIINSYAQQASVENSVDGIQIGILGMWYHSEVKATNQIAIRGEFGLDGGIFGGEQLSSFLFAPVITVEPRWYYNLNRRMRKSKRIKNNTGNFLSLKTSYHPDIIIFTNENNVDLISDISFIPTWGIRRSIGEHFIFETGFGIGYIRYLEDNNIINFDKNDVGVNLHFRIGYNF